MAARSHQGAIRLLLGMLDESYDHPAWHGPNLRGALRGLSAEQANWRPKPGAHCIWEIALHCAYWVYAVGRRLTGSGRRGSFPHAPSNWPRIPARPLAAAWKADLALLDAMHDRLRQAVESLSERSLSAVPRGSRTTVERLVVGIAAHNLYHAGQIRLIIRLAGAKRKRKKSQ